MTPRLRNLFDAAIERLEALKQGQPIEPQELVRAAGIPRTPAIAGGVVHRAAQDYLRDRYERGAGSGGGS